MENKLFKNMTSIIMVIIMVMSIMSIPALSGNSTVNAEIPTTYKNKCSVTVSPALAVNGTSRITLTGYNANGAEQTVKIIPHSVSVQGNYYWPTFQYTKGEANTFSFYSVIDYPDNYIITAKFLCYSYNTTYNTWSWENEYIVKNSYSIKPKVILNANKGKINGKSSVTKTCEMNSPLNKFGKATRKGFTFTGWYASKKGYNSEKLGTNYNIIVKDLYYKNTTSKTVYAHWKKKIKVKFNANKGRVSKKSKKVTYISNSIKKTYGKLPTPTRKGKYFAGWYTKKKGGKRIGSYSDVTKTKNHTLYAQWY